MNECYEHFKCEELFKELLKEHMFSSKFDKCHHWVIHTWTRGSQHFICRKLSIEHKTDMFPLKFWQMSPIEWFILWAQAHNISYVGNFLKNFKRTHFLIKIFDRCHHLVIHSLTRASPELSICSMLGLQNSEVTVRSARWNKCNEKLLLGPNGKRL
jgi:hypothetical protein